MIYSMTAFARTQSQGSWGAAACELKSVNHRYGDFRVHLPEGFYELEQPMLEYLRQHVQRGKVECYFRFQAGEAVDAPLQVNFSLAKRLIEAGQQIAQFLPQALAVNPMDVLQWPGVVQAGHVNLTGIHEMFMTLFKTAVQELLAARQREGEELKNIFLQRLQGLLVELAKAKQQLPAILQHQRDKLLKYFSEAQIGLDPLRLEQEMVLFAQKIDVTEEIERIETHVAEVRRVLKEGGLAGRRLDFLMQELNREANTLGAKSVHVVTTHASLEMKVIIDQLREQMQNIE